MKITVYSFFISVLVGTVLFLNCSSYEKVHVITYDDAFFLPDGNIGVVGWEYDADIPEGAWDSPEWSNINQYFYSYNRQTRELTLLATLAEDVWALPAYPGACRLGNWVAYETVIDGNRTSAIGVFDLAQGKIVATAGIETGTSFLLQGISQDGKYLFAEDGIAFNLSLNANKLEVSRSFPFYINGDSLIFSFAYRPFSPSLDTAWLTTKNLNSGNLDTIQILPKWQMGRVTSDGKYLLCGISINSSGRGNPFMGIDLDSLMAGKFSFDTITISNDSFTSKSDYNRNTGDFVFQNFGSIYLGNTASTEPEKIIAQLTTQR